MPGDIEQVKLELLESYESHAPIDIDAWVGRYPNCRDELLDYWMWLSGTPRVNEVEALQSIEGADEIADEAVRQACLAVTLGPQWLAKPFDPDLQNEEALGADLARIRETHYEFQGRASKAFRKAVVYSWIVQRLAERRGPVTRLATQKVAYVLEGALDLGLFIDHEQKPRGPYDHKAKYRDAEPIATRNGWIQIVGGKLEVGEGRAQVDRYLRRYVRSEPLALRLVERLGQLVDEELEVWATVIWASRELTSKKKPVSVEGIQSILLLSPEWRAKLERPAFRPEAIAKALTNLARLRLLGG